MVEKHDMPVDAGSRHPLATEHPISEKDEQAYCIERMRKLQSEALKIWRALKKKQK